MTPDEYCSKPNNPCGACHPGCYNYPGGEYECAECGADDHPTSECPNKVVKPPFYTVAVYLCDRAYGGPEEGGWWYDTGTRQDEIKWDDGKPVAQIFADEEDASAYANRVNEWLNDELNNDGANRDLSSVNCRGRYCAEVHEGYPPEHYPDHRPHYE